MISTRIKEARLAAGLTLKELSSSLQKVGYGISPAGISKYEVGKSKPPPSYLHALGAVLRLKASHFATEPKVTIEWLAFRKHSRLGKSQQTRVQAWAASYVEKQIWLHETLCPDLRPTFPRPIHCTTMEEAEAAAQALRRKWDLDEIPIESVTQAIEDRGGVVVEYPRDERRFDGLSGWANNVYPVMVVSATAPADRRRLSLAHELGHLVMDCRHVDNKTQESLAYRFGAAFIVPTSVARRELGQRRRSLHLRELAILKQKHGLSMQGWALRARDLCIISQGHYETLCRQFSARGWRKQEPTSYEGQERASRLSQLVFRALSEGIITPSRAEEILPGVQSDEEIARPELKSLKPSPIELMKLPRTERRKRLAASAAKVAQHYSVDAT